MNKRRLFSLSRTHTNPYISIEKSWLKWICLGFFFLSVLYSQPETVPKLKPLKWQAAQSSCFITVTEFWISNRSLFFQPGALCIMMGYNASSPVITHAISSDMKRIAACNVTFSLLLYLESDVCWSFVLLCCLFCLGIFIQLAYFPAPHPFGDFSLLLSFA